MDLSLAEEMLDELLPPFEALETQSAAILQFLKDKGIASDDQLAPYLEQARGASAVRWRAVRLRMNRLLTLARKAAEESTEKVSQQPAQNPAETGGPPKESRQEKELTQEKERIKGGSESPGKSAGETKDVAPAAEQKEQKKATPSEDKGERAA